MITRRHFVQSIAGGALAKWSLSAPARVIEPPNEVVVKSARSLGPFPHVSAPQMVRQSDELMGLFVLRGSASQLFYGRRKLQLPQFDCVKLVQGPANELYVAGVRRRELMLITVRDFRVGDWISLGKLHSHPAIGLDAVWTPNGVRIAAPGREPRTLALYSSDGSARTLAVNRWLHPRLSYDIPRSRLHLAFSAWNEFSSIYDVVYYLRTENDGQDWQTSSGELLNLPLRPWPPEHGDDATRCETVSARGQSAGGESNTLVHSFSTDSSGRPHLLYSFCRPYLIAVGPSLPGPPQPRMRTKLVWLSESGWQSQDIAADQGLDVAGGQIVLASDGQLHGLFLCKDQANDWLDLGYASAAHGHGWTPVRFVTTDANSARMHYVAPAALIGRGQIDYASATMRSIPGSTVVRGRFAIA